MTHTTGQNNIGQSTGAGGLAELVSVVDPSGSANALGPEAYLKIALLGVLFVIVNYWQWPGLLRDWVHDEDWQIGLAIPLFSLYLIYSRRHELLRAPRQGCAWGMVVIAGALLMDMLGFYPLGVYYICHVAMVLLLLGLVLYLAGTKVMRVLWVPIGYWVLAMPLPKLLYNNITFPLQNLAARGATMSLQAVGVDINAYGSTLEGFSVTHQAYSLEVAEACSGIRSLMAYLALGIAIAYLEDRPLWQRVTLVLCTIPVAIFTNILRVTITATMYNLDKPDWGRDFMHDLTGIAMLVPAFLILWFISWVLAHIFVEVEEEPPPAQGRPAA